MPVAKFPLSCVWDGKFPDANVTVFEPPVLFVLVPLDLPKINLSVKFGVQLLPSHRTKPEGIFASVPLHITIRPDGIVEPPSIVILPLVAEISFVS